MQAAISKLLTMTDTPLRTLIDLELRLSTGYSLVEVVGFYRQPGEGFTAWNNLPPRLAELCGRTTTRVSLHNWMLAAGVPDMDDVAGRNGTVVERLAFRKSFTEGTGLHVPLERPVRRLEVPALLATLALQNRAA